MQSIARHEILHLEGVFSVAGGANSKPLSGVELGFFQKRPFVHNSVCSQFLEGLFAILAECSQFCLGPF